MLIDVMIIDDDNDIHKYLKEVIDWEGLGLRLTCEAEDSITASEMYLLYSPKIIFIDICISNITGITGLDLAKEFYKQDPNVKIIIITGYTDFEYAKEAISLGVSELLPKPLCPDEVKSSLIKAISLLEHERNKYFAENAIKQIIDENIDSLRRSEIRDIVCSDTNRNEKEILEQLKQLSIKIISENYAVIKVALRSKAPRSNNDLYLMVIKNYIESKLTENSYNFFLFPSDGFALDCLVGWSFAGGADRLEALFGEICKEGISNIRIKIIVGIGGMVDSLTRLRFSALEAEKCLKYCNFENEPIISYLNIEALESEKEIVIRANPLKEIEEYLTAHDCDYVVGVISKMFDESGGEAYSLEEIRKYSVDYLLLLSKYCMNFEAHLWNTAEFNRIVNQVFTAADKNVIKLSLLSLTYEVMSLMKKRISNKDNHKSQVIVAAKDYVNEHLTEMTLGFDEVCNHIGLTKIYFGRIFRKEEGISFNIYINTERIWYSKKLLINTNLKVGDVASKSGFSNTKYFSIVFKSIVGITPLEFRRTKRLNV